MKLSSMIVSSIYLTAIIATCVIETQLFRADAFCLASNRRQQRLSSSSSNSGYIITTSRSRNTHSSLSAGAVAGPKGDGRRRPSRRGTNTNTNSDASTRPRRATGRSSRTTRTQRDTASSSSRDKTTIPFDGARLTSTQIPNDNAPPLDLKSCSTLRLRSTSTSYSKRSTMGPTIHHDHIEYLSLDDLFPNLNFSSLFHTNASFRQSIRRSMRHDIFHSTPSYAKLSDKAASFMLDDDSSLQGSWRCPPNHSTNGGRMTQLTQVLQHHLGTNAPTGDQFLNTIGSLCGSNPSTHWIDIVGVKDRVLSHSWHQDTGRRSAGPLEDREEHEDQHGSCASASASTSSYTVMLGFPCVDSYTGTGVFSHVVRLQSEHWAPEEEEGHGMNNEPVLWEGSVEEEYIIRPIFDLGRELVRYRDVDVIHSAPDVAYRCSVMRFM